MLCLYNQFQNILLKFCLLLAKANPAPNPAERCNKFILYLKNGLINNPIPNPINVKENKSKAVLFSAISLLFKRFIL